MRIALGMSAREVADRLAAADWKAFSNAAETEALYHPHFPALTEALTHPGNRRDFADALHHAEAEQQIRLGELAHGNGHRSTPAQHARRKLARTRQRAVQVAAMLAEPAAEVAPADRCGWARTRLARAHPHEYRQLLDHAGQTVQARAAHTLPLARQAALMPDRYPLTDRQQTLRDLADGDFAAEVAQHLALPVWSRNRPPFDHPQLVIRWAAALDIAAVRLRDTLGIGPDHGNLRIVHADVATPHRLPGEQMRAHIAGLYELAAVYRHLRYARRAWREASTQVRDSWEQENRHHRDTAIDILVGRHPGHYATLLAAFDARRAAEDIPADPAGDRPRRSTSDRRRSRVLDRDNHTCGYCGGDATTVDHIVPLIRGGRSTWENLVACCYDCNQCKGGRTPHEAGMALRIVPARPAAARPRLEVLGSRGC